MKILRNKKLLILSITAIALLTLTLGVSYAYFTATVTGNDSAVVTKIVAGILDVDFTITDRISNDNIILIKDERREEKAETLDFTVSNNGRGTLDAVYYVYLTDLNITNNLKSPDFKWELIKNDDTVFTGNFSSAETNTDFTITSETNNGIVIPVKQELSVGQVDRYKLRIWLSETDADQNSLLNGSFSGKVRVTSTQLTGTEKYVVFKDQSGTQLGKKIISDGKTNYTMDISSVNLTGSTNIYCNNGGIPTISNNTLNIDGISNEVECKISNDINTTLNNLPESKTGIVMTNNDGLNQGIKLESGDDVSIDFNGKTISYTGGSTSYVLLFNISGGNLNFSDRSNEGGIIINNNTTQIMRMFSGELNIYGGRFRSGENVIFVGGNADNPYDYAQVNVYDGYFTVHSPNDSRSVLYVGDQNDSETNINLYGGTFIADNEVEVNRVIYTRSATVNVRGGYFENYNDNGDVFETLASNSSTTNFYGGTFRTKGITINNSSSAGNIYIYGGDFQSTAYDTVYNKGIMTINGDQATFDGSRNYVSGVYIHNDYGEVVYNYGGTLTITNGTFEGNMTNEQSDISNQTLRNELGGTTIVNGGLFDGGRGIRNRAGTLTLNNITVNTFGSRSNNILTCVGQENNAGAVTNIINSTLNCAGYGIRNQGVGTINIKNTTVNTDTNIAILNNSAYDTYGVINICSVNLVNNTIVRNVSDSYTYYHSNAFGSVTPTFNGNTDNIIIKDSVCD